MVTDSITDLSVYLTGSRVAMHSINLQLGGMKKTEANAFFALRDSFGISGYMTPDEALAAINETLGI